LITVFAEQLFFGEVSRFTWKMLFLAMALALPNLFVPGFIMEYILRVWQVMTLFTITYSFTVTVKAVRMRLPNSRRLFWGMTALILTAVFDILDSLILNTGLAFTKFAFLIFVIGVAGMLSNRFLELYEEVEDHRNNLEKKVTERTKELQSTLQQVQILKEQQDGNYFLTTLIVNPLIAKKSSSESVKIDFLISQKKKFDFKKKIHEIGGDICISESIVLRGKKYSVFVNGDAMGKSIQGAGGALVLGVVFHSLVSRTRYFRTNKDIFPERWLKMAFQELQSVFESFDGSMLISVVMGLIDDENGAMYYMNAEHPWTVLYRDGKASFIEDELTVHKLGMTIMESRFTVKTFQLLDNDVIIIGSDGRDDLKLFSGDGNAINEDGDLFLKTVEETGAVLREIYEKTREIGEITDDFSLLLIHYNEIKWEYDAKQFDLHMKKAQLLYRKARRREAIDEFEKAYSHKRSEKNLLRIIARIFMKMKEYERAGNYFAKYAEASPLDEKYIYMTAEAYRESGRTEDAIDFSERLRIRNPFDIRNLKLLIALYENTGNTEKAEGLREDLELVLNQNVMI
ncbi:MAG TPA: SpoIIE family protein phosphatase, partial [Leptospiraceae bacterium]|nr:SpoIIE family protein phosphatase [Leptospiraceae bacterium]